MYMPFASLPIRAKHSPNKVNTNPDLTVPTQSDLANFMKMPTPRSVSDNMMGDMMSMKSGVSR